MSVAPIPIIGERCHYCSKFRNPNEILRLPGSVKLCWRCYEWHHRALASLTRGVPPPGCQSCGVKFMELKEELGDGNVQMCIQVKDGVYQVLCKPCGMNYASKRRDLYGKTAWGHKQNLY